MNIVIQKIFSIIDCTAHPDNLYIFGDNLGRIGHGGQAIIRNCLNSKGIATKKSIWEYFSDKDLELNKVVIDQDIKNVLEDYKFYRYTNLVFPFFGLGTGLSAMQSQCPKTFIYLCQRLLDVFNFNNLANLKPE